MFKWLLETIKDELSLICPSGTEEKIIWHGPGSGSDKVGEKVFLDGKRGIIVSGSEMYIYVRWNLHDQLNQKLHRFLKTGD